MLTAIFLVFFLFFPAYAQAEPKFPGEVLDYSLNVSFDIAASQIRGQAKIGVKKGQEIELQKGNLHILEVSLNQKKMDLAGRIETLKLQPQADGFLEIKYVGTFKSAERFEGPASQGQRISPRVIDPRGIFLTGIWYPKSDRLCTYHLTATLPPEYEAVSEADSVTTATQDGQKVVAFNFPHPLDSLNLIATGRFQVMKDQMNGTEVFAYFFPEDENLARTYVEHTKKYLKLYESLIGKYPYQRFSVVENFLPTGFSMPTFTLLGQEVVRLPFIVETSLGHEILHQWFGNSVYVEYGKGNWAEGLTAYLSDHLYENQKGKGYEYRKGLLIDYQSYVNEINEMPLKDFRERGNRSSQAIGYGKALLVFHMLKNLMGEDKFQDSLRHFVKEKRFQRASWEDLQKAFEGVARKDLKSFFRQWVEEKGLMDLSLAPEVKVTPREGKFEVLFTIAQKKKNYRADVPVFFYSDLGKVRHLFAVEKDSNHFKAILEEWPRRIVVDENYDLARILSPNEYPPVVARLLGEHASLVVLPPTGGKIYQTIIERFQKKGARVEEPANVKPADLQSSSVIVLGEDNSIAERLFGRVAKEGGFSLTVKENPWNPQKVIGIFQARSKKEVDDAYPKIGHYGKFSEVSFDQGRNVSKRTEASSRGVVKELYPLVSAAEVATVRDLADVTGKIGDRKIIYVGESHDQFSHHVVQLEIIRALHRKGKKIAIGMEMFQRPFQRPLDEYLAGKIEEKEFLKQTEYFQRWRFDYHLYRPILQFARAEKVPVIALNVPAEIVEKVAREGLGSLSQEERQSVPQRMDFSDDAYRDRLKGIFREHATLAGKDFDSFFQAQVLWDETMAESVDIFLKNQPEYQMVVLAGSGHLAFGSGIPKRAARRNGLDYAILLNDMPLEKEIATYVLFPGFLPVESSPKLMVLLGEEKGQVVIQGFTADSVSEKAGLKKGDVILSIDQTAIRSTAEARLEMLYKTKGKPVKVTVLRKEASGKEEEMEFQITPG